MNYWGFSIHSTPIIACAGVSLNIHSFIPIIAIFLFIVWYCLSMYTRGSDKRIFGSVSIILIKHLPGGRCQSHSVVHSLEFLIYQVADVSHIQLSTVLSFSFTRWQMSVTSSCPQSWVSHLPGGICQSHPVVHSLEFLIYQVADVSHIQLSTVLSFSFTRWQMSVTSSCPQSWVSHLPGGRCQSHPVVHSLEFLIYQVADVSHIQLSTVLSFSFTRWQLSVTSSCPQSWVSHLPGGSCQSHPVVHSLEFLIYQVAAVSHIQLSTVLSFSFTRCQMSVTSSCPQSWVSHLPGGSCQSHPVVHSLEFLIYQVADVSHIQLSTVLSFSFTRWQLSVTSSCPQSWVSHLPGGNCQSHPAVHSLEFLIYQVADVSHIQLSTQSWVSHLPGGRCQSHPVVHSLEFLIYQVADVSHIQLSTVLSFSFTRWQMSVTSSCPQSWVSHLPGGRCQSHPVVHSLEFLIYQVADVSHIQLSTVLSFSFTRWQLSVTSSCPQSWVSHLPGGRCQSHPVVHSLEFLIYQVAAVSHIQLSTVLSFSFTRWQLSVTSSCPHNLEFLIYQVADVSHIQLSTVLSFSFTRWQMSVTSSCPQSWVSHLPGGSCQSHPVVHSLEFLIYQVADVSHIQLSTVLSFSFTRWQLSVTSSCPQSWVSHLPGGSCQSHPVVHSLEFLIYQVAAVSHIQLSTVLSFSFTRWQMSVTSSCPQSWVSHLPGGRCQSHPVVHSLEFLIYQVADVSHIQLSTVLGFSFTRWQLSVTFSCPQSWVSHLPGGSCQSHPVVHSLEFLIYQVAAVSHIQLSTVLSFSFTRWQLSVTSSCPQSWVSHLPGGSCQSHPVVHSLEFLIYQVADVSHIQLSTVLGFSFTRWQLSVTSSCPQSWVSHLPGGSCQSHPVVHSLEFLIYQVADVSHIQLFTVLSFSFTRWQMSVTSSCPQSWVSHLPGGSCQSHPVVHSLEFLIYQVAVVSHIQLSTVLSFSFTRWQLSVTSSCPQSWVSHLPGVRCQSHPVVHSLEFLIYQVAAVSHIQLSTVLSFSFTRWQLSVTSSCPQSWVSHLPGGRCQSHPVVHSLEFLIYQVAAVSHIQLSTVLSFSFTRWQLSVTSSCPQSWVSHLPGGSCQSHPVVHSLEFLIYQVADVSHIQLSTVLSFSFTRWQLSVTSSCPQSWVSHLPGGSCQSHPVVHSLEFLIYQVADVSHIQLSTVLSFSFTRWQMSVTSSCPQSWVSHLPGGSCQSHSVVHSLGFLIYQVAAVSHIQLSTVLSFSFTRWQLSVTSSCPQSWVSHLPGGSCQSHPVVHSLEFLIYQVAAVSHIQLSTVLSFSFTRWQMSVTSSCPQSWVSHLPGGSCQSHPVVHSLEFLIYQVAAVSHIQLSTVLSFSFTRWQMSVTSSCSQSWVSHLPGGRCQSHPVVHSLEFLIYQVAAVSHIQLSTVLSFSFTRWQLSVTSSCPQSWVSHLPGGSCQSHPVVHSLEFLIYQVSDVSHIQLSTVLSFSFTRWQLSVTSSCPQSWVSHLPGGSCQSHPVVHSLEFLIYQVADVSHIQLSTVLSFSFTRWQMSVTSSCPHNLEFLIYQVADVSLIQLSTVLSFSFTRWQMSVTSSCPQSWVSHLPGGRCQSHPVVHSLEFLIYQVADVSHIQLSTQSWVSHLPGGRCQSHPVVHSLEFLIYQVAAVSLIQLSTVLSFSFTRWQMSVSSSCPHSLEFLIYQVADVSHIQLSTVMSFSFTRWQMSVTSSCPQSWVSHLPGGRCQSHPVVHTVLSFSFTRWQMSVTSSCPQSWVSHLPGGRCQSHPVVHSLEFLIYQVADVSHIQ